MDKQAIEALKDDIGVFLANLDDTDDIVLALKGLQAILDAHTPAAPTAYKAT